jgi:hypothetical protein
MEEAQPALGDELQGILEMIAALGRKAGDEIGAEGTSGRSCRSVAQNAIAPGTAVPPLHPFEIRSSPACSDNGDAARAAARQWPP